MRASVWALCGVRVYVYVGGRFGECVRGCVSGRVGGRACGSVGGWVGGSVVRCLDGRMRVCASKTATRACVRGQ